MDTKKRTRNSKTQKTEAKLRRSLRIQSLKNCSRELPELPLDITLNIISWLPVKSILRCKSLSKTFNNLISEPPFSQLYRTNRSNLFYTFYVTGVDRDSYLNLDEFDQTVIYNNGNCDGQPTKLLTFDLGVLPGYSYDVYDYDLMWGYCNGLLCTRKEADVISNLYHLFVINPITGQYIQLPEPGVRFYDLLANGIGFCQLTNRYKVLRLITNYSTRDRECDYNTEIFTIGSDQNWRILEYVPYNINKHFSPYHQQPPMLAFRSALHWIVRPDTLLFEWAGGGPHICAFDMTKEKASPIPMPPQVDASYARLSVLLDKLSVWGGHGHAYDDVNVWVMDDYNAKCSWTKQFVFKLSTLHSSFIDPHGSIPLTLLPEGVLVLSDDCVVMFYDRNKDKCFVSDIDEVPYQIPFVPSFVSLTDPFRG